MGPIRKPRTKREITTAATSDENPKYDSIWRITPEGKELAKVLENDQIVRQHLRYRYILLKTYELKIIRIAPVVTTNFFANDQLSGSSGSSFPNRTRYLSSSDVDSSLTLATDFFSSSIPTPCTFPENRISRRLDTTEDAS